MKTCKKCGELKPLDQFSRASSTKDGKRGECKKCAAAISQQWREQHTDREMSSYRLRHYGISREHFEQMLAAQGGSCAICKRTESRHRNQWRTELCVDHDHTCCPKIPCCGNCVRGLICSECNRGLAAFDDNPELLRSAMDYLTRSPPEDR